MFRCDWVSSGYRAKFNLVLKSDLVAWALDNFKQYEQCKEIKSLIDGGASEADLPDVPLARLVYLWLTLSKQEGVELKNAAKFSAKDGDGANNADNDPKKGAAAVSKGGPGAKKAGQAPPAQAATGKSANAAPGGGRPESGPSAFTKRKDKLRDRSGKGDIKPAAIGDEPSDGPDVYYMFQDFNSAGFFNALIDEMEVPVGTFIHVEDGSKKTQDDSVVNPVWTQLLSHSLCSSESSQWRNTSWTTILSSEIKDHKDLFDVIARRIYTLHEKRKYYETYYNGEIVLHIPDVDPTITLKNDLRFYDYLMTKTTVSGVANEDLVLALLLEHLTKVTSQSIESIEYVSSEEMDLLSEYFDRAVLKLSINAHDYFSITGGEFPMGSSVGVDLVQFNNRQRLISCFLDTIRTLSVHPYDLLLKITNAYPANIYYRFLQYIPELSSVDVAHLMREMMVEKTEFHRQCSEKLVEATLEQLLSQIEFEKLLEPVKDGNLSSLSLDDWCWSESHDDATLRQVLQKAQKDHPEVYFKFFKGAGSLLVAFLGSGPLGALQHTHSETIQAHTKVGFAMFNELLQQNSPYISPAGEDRPPHVVYSGVEQYLKIDQQISYLYPSNDVQIRNHHLKSRGVTRVFYNIVSWNDNVISFANEAKSKNGPYFTVSFNDGSVFSCSKDASGTYHAQISTEDSQLINYMDNGYISQRFTGKNANVYSKRAENETSRVIIPTGTVIRYLNDDSTQVLFADGSLVTNLGKDKETIKITRDGKKVVEKGGATIKTEQINVAFQQNFPTKKVIITREDMVTISREEDNSIVAQHADGTKFVTHPGLYSEVQTPEMATIRMEQGKDTVHFSESLLIERTSAINASMSEPTAFNIMKDDIMVHVEFSGKASVTLSSVGYKTPVRDRVINLDWKTGTLSFEDFDGTTFRIDESGTTTADTSTKSPNPSPVSRLFGGRILSHRLNGAKSSELSGNLPKLFLVNYDGSGEELHRDDDILRYFQRSGKAFTQLNEQTAADPSSVSVTTIMKIKTKLSPDPVLLYRQLRRNPQIPPQVRNKVRQEYLDFQAKLSTRFEPILRPRTQSSVEKADSSISDSRQFTYGQNRVETEQAIVLRYWLKEDLALRNRITHQVTKTAVNDEPSWRKPRILDSRVSTVNTSSKLSKSSSASTTRKSVVKLESGNMKYFESPEGKAFLAKNKPTTPIQTPLTNIRGEKIKNLSRSILLEPVKLEPENTHAITLPVQATSSVTPKNSRVPTTNQTAEAAENVAGSELVKPKTPSSTKTKLHKDESTPKPAIVGAANQVTNAPVGPLVGDNPRKATLPAAIKGSKPGVEPNLSYLKREGEARRKIRTASTLPAKSNDGIYSNTVYLCVNFVFELLLISIIANYGVGSFVVLPAYCKFGSVEKNACYEKTLVLTNVGIDSTRFTVKQPKTQGIHVDFKPGPVCWTHFCIFLYEYIKLIYIIGCCRNEGATISQVDSLSATKWYNP